ncbi:MAG TPA: type 1 glutamine amidotransferase [Candidatus Methanoperedens sp.]|nr:type 1 glutamine amidotransferase [Candidatus Methanoperedens sp.]
MRVLVIMHVESEGPGLFGAFLKEAGAEVRTARLHRGEALPAAGEIDAAISLGGPMNVYEEAKHPFLADETLFLRDAAALGLPVLGICLGAQMIAKAAGAAVTKNPVSELGWAIVSLTAAGKGDPLFAGLPDILPVFQWHGDTFAIPEGGALLATGGDCRNQALRHRNSWGLQFHLEADRALLAAWFAGTLHEREILRRHDALGLEVARHARALLGNFLDVAAARRRPG